MNLPIKTKIYINPVYKYFLYQYVRNNLYSHQTCKGNSYSTFECEKYLHKKKLFHRLANQIQSTIELSLDCKGYMHTMWFNVNKKGSKTSIHHHNDQRAENKISGVYYFSKPKNSGNFIFHNPEPTILEIKTNDVLIFDADLMHETEINNSNKNRIVCGFNFMIT